jgi:hypothetical protein
MPDAASRRWMTYAEIAVALGLPSAKAGESKARRAKWERQLGNDGFARVAVPLSVLENAPPPRRPLEGATEASLAPSTDRMAADLRGAYEAVIAESLRRAAAAEARLAEAEKQLAEIPSLREAIGASKGEAEALRGAVKYEREARSRAEAEAAAQKERAGLALGELEGVKLATQHQHAELAQMRQEVAEAHNRAVTAEQQVIEAARLREGAEVALAKARSWNFLNFLFGREGKGRR